MTRKNKMNIDETIKGRRSFRKYQNKDIPDAVINELLDLARHAPSSMNGQPWFFIIVRDGKIKKQLAGIKNKYCPFEKQEYRADFLQDAPVLIVVCADRHKSYDREVENGVLATANIMLGASSKGLGSVYMSAYKDGEPAVSEEIRQVMGIPENIDPVTIIPLGYPDEVPGHKELRPLGEIVSYDIFSEK